MAWHIPKLKVFFIVLAISSCMIVLALLAIENEVRSVLPILQQLIPVRRTYFPISKTQFKEQFNGSYLSILVFNPPEWISVKETNKTLVEECGISNCRLTSNQSDLLSHSAIIYYLTAAPALPQKPPITPSVRNPDQVWIFAWLESPVHHTGDRTIYQNEHWRHTLNWTMTYTHAADVLYPYGAIKPRTPPANKDYSALFHRKSKMVAWAVSHCHTQSQRTKYVEKLQQYGVYVNRFGKCVKNTIDPDTLQREINLNYKFYLSFENSLCTDYITEKFFDYFSYDVILVVRGAGNYSSFIPKDSYINTADFDSVEDLAKHLHSVGSSEELYIKYLMNKDRFESISTDIRTNSFCRICDKLNNLKQNRRIYGDLLDRVHNGTCFQPSDIK